MNFEVKFFLPLGPKVKITYPKHFNRGVFVQLYEEKEKINFNQLIAFLISLDLNFTSKKSQSQHQEGSHSVCSVFCDRCKIKLFRIFIFNNFSKIQCMSLCIHTPLQKEGDSLCFFDFFNNSKFQFCNLNSDYIKKDHPIRVVDQSVPLAK